VIKEQCGTPAYLAPEIIIDEGYEGFYADIWSLGVLLYAMLQGTVPFKANNIADLHKLILKGQFDFAVESISEESKDLIRKMLVLTPDQRISLPEMLNHPWLRETDSLDDGEEDEHDLKVGATFFRSECLNGIVGGSMESGNINYINVENIYYKSIKETAQIAANGGEPVREQTKMSYSDYCALTEDFMTYRIDEDAIQIVENYGYPRKLVIDSINKGEINHATSCYYLLIHSTN
jgi:serine/threonine protein kinase